MIDIIHTLAQKANYPFEKGYKNATTQQSYTKNEIKKAYFALRDLGSISLSLEQEQVLLANLKVKNVRTSSGVTPVTVLTKPYPCPGQCIFCPSDVRMPKSYLSNEPGAQRAHANRFDPYLQTFNRLVAYFKNGHNTDKCELIILGGTWSVYPENYRIWFIKRCFDAMNDFNCLSNIETKLVSSSFPYNESLLKKNEDTLLNYNQTVSLSLENTESCSWELLFSSQKVNETALTRCVGLVVETRPDEVNTSELINLRKLGVTKVQLGIQSLDDSVLLANKRGHTVMQVKGAVDLLRSFGFKIQAHYMFNLLGSSPEKDFECFTQLFTDPSLCPDELKMYPCSLIASAELYTYYQKGLWKAYSEEELLNLLKKCYPLVPRYCRVSRVIRDFSSGDIVEGNKKTNLRQILEEELESTRVPIQEIRYREIKNKNVSRDDILFRTTSYYTSVSEERFLEFVTPSDAILGFLRLSLPTSTTGFLPELEQAALIREIHVYGEGARLGENDLIKIQHRGLGKSLISSAKEMAVDAGYKKLSVISSVGTREYYRANGFHDGELYQHFDLA